jgi:hypothetical protein
MQHVITGGRNSQFSIEHAFASLSEVFTLLVFLSVTLAPEANLFSVPILLVIVATST